MSILLSINIIISFKIVLISDSLNENIYNQLHKQRKLYNYRIVYPRSIKFHVTAKYPRGRCWHGIEERPF